SGIRRSGVRGLQTSCEATGSRSSPAIWRWRARSRAWCLPRRAIRYTPTSARWEVLPFSSCEPPSKEQAEVGIEMMTRDKIDAAVRILAEAASPARIVLSMRRTIYELLVLLTFLCTSAFVWAADYPVRPVTVLGAFPPGGASDVLARIVTRKLEEVLGQPFIIENRPGAGGNVAAEAVARAAPDGYTLLNGTNAILATNAALYKKINFDAVADFAPVGLIGSQANILVVNPALPVRSMAELISLARANPGKLNFASSGHGLAAHLAGELFKAEAKIELVHVPYKGAAPALQDVIAGHVQMMFATASSVVPHIRDGKLVPLGVATLKRTAVLPDIPTIDELGIKNFDATTWHGLVAPAHTPKDVIVTLNRALAAALDDPDVKTSLAALG